MSAATSSKIGSTIEKLPPRGSNHRGLDTEGVTSMPRELSKICAHCSGEFFKSPRKSLNHWKKRRFCSIDCANAGLRAERQAIPVMERISDRIDRSGDCWLWTGAKANTGYGQLRIDNKPLLSHRVVYEQIVGPIPEGLSLDHLCRVPACCNPAHLEPVTHLENCHRGLQGALKTHCANGHPWTEENKMRNGTSSNGSPAYRCRICKSEQRRVRK